MTLLLLKLLLSYMLGSVSGSLLFGRARGVDIRNQGSGNAGATNALRTQGWRFALAVLLFDFGKGAVAATLIADFGGPVPGSLSSLATELGCGLFCALGHCYPVWYGFRGGKGAATLFGAHFAVVPLAAAVALLAWLLCLGSTGYVGLSTVVAALVLVAGVAVRDADPVALLFSVLGAALIIWAHRGNLQRLLAGTESRFQRARILKFW